MSAALLQAVIDCLSATVSAIAPRRCASCDAAARSIICDSCLAIMEAAPRPAPRPGPRGVLMAAFVFEEPLRHAIHRGKYGGQRMAMEALAELAAPRLVATARPRHWQVLVPVPLGSRRARERGFNQAEVVAAAMGRAMTVQVSCDLQRIRETPPQACADEGFRRANVAGAFRWRGGRLDGVRVALIDDVVTTGATAGAATEALSEAGAATVDVAALAAVP